MRFSAVDAVRIPEGSALRIRHDGKRLWSKIIARYVSFGDSIAAGHTIDENWETDYGTGSQYGVNGNTETAIVPGCYTDLIRDALISMYGGNINATSFARSGDTVEDLIAKLDHDVVKKAIAKADYVTVCIGANDVLGAFLSNLNDYINSGNLNEIISEIEANLAILADDTNSNSFKALFDKFTALNPDATIVFTTVYNPYKYLWIEEGKNGFFEPLLDAIPQLTILGFEVDEYIKDYLLDTDVVQALFTRVNGLKDPSEKYVNQLNEVLKNKIAAYQSTNPNIILADTKAVYDPVPDRPISAPKHYNDLVSVEYTKGYDTAQMDWGQLWADSSVYEFWYNLVVDYVSLSGVDVSGMAEELVPDIVEKVITPDVDPHPETYGHHALLCSFMDALGWEELPRRTITFNANGGSGSMVSQTVIALDGYTAYANINANAFTHGTEGYYFTGWNTASDGSGTSYSNGQFIGLDSDLVLYAQWSNLYRVIYKHTNHTNLYGDDETGHMECYALYINGELKPKFGTFAEGSTATYYIPYGSTMRVVVSNYNPTELTYDDVDCDVYWNGSNVASGYRGTEYTFALTCNVTIDFRWKIAGSLVTFDMRSWEDCYITTG